MTESAETIELREKLHAFYEAMASYQERILQAASGYNQIVVLAGYAGFFTIWSAAKDDVPHWLLLTSGLLMGLSLIIYVAWTIYGMTITTQNNVQLLNVIGEGPDGYVARLQATAAEQTTKVAAYMRFWRPVLWCSGLPALLAGLLIATGAFSAVAWPQTRGVTCNHAVTRSSPQPRASLTRH